MTAREIDPGPAGTSTSEMQNAASPFTAFANALAALIGYPAPAVAGNLFRRLDGRP